VPRNIVVVPLAELRAFRVVCPREDCGGVTEVTVERLRARFETAACPVCGHNIVPNARGSGHNAIYRLAKLIEEFHTIGAAAAVEFVIPDPADDVPVNSTS
jgi:hypothetical protein